MARKFSKGWSGGYTAYRYGDKRSKVHVPGKSAEKAILTRAQRDAAVRQVEAVLRGWKHSPFQFEAPCRYGLRAAMCLAGHRWARSDLLADEIVAEALRNMRARRPTWREGQRDITDTVENCVHCRKPLDDSQIAHADRFCSAECAKTRLAAMDAAWSRETDVTTLSAQKIATFAARPKMECEVCHKSFRPRGHSVEGARYCSPKCRGGGQRIHGERECECCHKTFLPSHTQGQRFCSIACKEIARAAAEPTFHRECALCGKPFSAKTAQSRYCSKVCRNQVAYYRTKGLPSVVTPRAFDYLIMPIVADRPAWLAPARFDELLAA